MRVLHVTAAFYPAMAYGGPIVSTYQLFSELAGLGCTVRVLTTNVAGPRSRLDVLPNREVAVGRLRVRYCAAHFDIARMPDVSPALLAYLPAAVRWADVVHLTSVYSFPTIPTLMIARMASRPTVWSPRGSFLRWPGDKRVAIKWAWEELCRQVLPRRVSLHATSEAEADACRKRFPKLSIVTIANGVALPCPHSARVRDATLRILFLGRIHPIKAIDNLLRACALLSGDWTLTIAGAGDAAYTQELAVLAHALGIAQRVTFVGEVDTTEKASRFRAADLLVLPSHSENFGIVVAEALAHGVAVVASKQTPWAGVEAHGCGAWCSNDPASLAAAIERLRNQQLGEMGMRGRRWMASEFSWPRKAQEMLSEYQRLLGTGTAVAPQDRHA